MKRVRTLLAPVAMTVALGIWSPLQAQDPVSESQSTTAPVSSAVEADGDVHDEIGVNEHEGHQRVIFALDRDARLAAGEHADAVVAIAGSAIAAGDVDEAVVAVFGDARTSGAVGEAVVAVFGAADVAGRVKRDVVAVLGDVTLGPEAEIGGNVVAVGGRVIRDPAAHVQGDIQEVVFPGGEEITTALGTWFRHCALLGRPLALTQGLEWAWGLALGFLALYVTLALLFSRSVEACVRTFELHPGETLLASVLAVLLTPLVMVLLAITVIGAPLIPLFWLALLLAALFGKSVVLATLGRRITALIGGPFNHVAVAALIGGLIVLGLYLVPVLGFIVFNAFAMLAIGVVLYTLLLALKTKHEVRTAAVDPAVVAEPVSAEPVSTSQPTAPGASASLPRAHFWIRMAALLIDVVLVGVIASVVDHGSDVTLILLAVYGAAMWKLRGTTIGGILCNLQVVRTDGRELDWATCIVRALSCFLSLAVAGLGFLWIAFNDERQAWHDKIAGTIVVRVPKAVSLV